MMQIEKITEKKLAIDYDFFETIFGRIIIASTQKGVCFLAFEDEKISALKDLKNRFPYSVFKHKHSYFQQVALKEIADKSRDGSEIRLHLKGTEFQFQVWQSLLKIPFGKIATYGKIAMETGHPKACRAVGTAIGNNPVSVIIPCHRVIQSSGKLGGYRWGIERKKTLLEFEKK
ncbi:MAG: methylated-DNA--[protein]-cysteine S-methyltransferase [Prevotellaceae bacterium]|jgi:AraC family transcriptional regulator of adaptative response/methylated-DNA-[protein]-cysteine methyltransferase|nr:methylated-DNA--[protein]-cysteine S-methyltransferase [Prevotellaceae bacterium]